MVEPARPHERDVEIPEADPLAVRRAYYQHRLKRQARIDRRRARRHAQLRFVAVVAILLALTVLLGLTIWHQIERLFGL